MVCLITIFQFSTYYDYILFQLRVLDSSIIRLYELFYSILNVSIVNITFRNSFFHNFSKYFLRKMKYSDQIQSLQNSFCEDFLKVFITCCWILFLKLELEHKMLNSSFRLSIEGSALQDFEPAKLKKLFSNLSESFIDSAIILFKNIDMIYSFQK